MEVQEKTKQTNLERYGVERVSQNEEIKNKAREKKSLPTLYITGGSRGSQIINQNVAKVVDKLTRLGEVIHQTGELDFLITMEKKDLPKIIRNRSRHQKRPLGAKGGLGFIGGRVINYFTASTIFLKTSG